MSNNEKYNNLMVQARLHVEDTENTITKIRGLLDYILVIQQNITKDIEYVQPK
jgi:hypothetical protein